MDKWKLDGLTQFLTNNSCLRMLEKVAGFKHLNTATDVTLSDTGSFRVFERVDGRLTKGMIFLGERFYIYKYSQSPSNMGARMARLHGG
jgi:hypothetical protein